MQIKESVTPTVHDNTSFSHLMGRSRYTSNRETNMLDVIFTLVIIASSIWVYWIATSNKIGKHPDQKGMLDILAGAWAVVTLLLWIIAFPLT